MDESKQASQFPLWIGILGVVLLLTGTLIYAAFELGTQYQPDRITRIAHDGISESPL